jgi:hypothetical protein
MKDNSIQAVLDAWNDGKPVWLDGVKENWDNGVLLYSGDTTCPWVVFDNFYVSFRHKATASLTPPESPKKKTRKMTALEMAYRQGARLVFRKIEWLEDEWVFVTYDGDDYDQMAPILDEGRRLGPWVDCSVEVEG